ncbi:hypothetical protein D3C72_1546680 [compost metagenome]
MFQHHAVLVGLGVNGGDQPLAESVVQGVIHVTHADAEAGSRIAIDVHVGHQSLILPVTGDVRQLRCLFQFRHQLRYPQAELVQRHGLQGKLVLGAADLGVDGQILHRLQIQLHAGELCALLLQTSDDGRNTVAAFAQGFEVDLQPAAVERGVAAIDANKRRQALHRRILEDFCRHLLLALGHITERH